MVQLFIVVKHACMIFVKTNNLLILVTHSNRSLMLFKVLRIKKKSYPYTNFFIKESEFG